MKHQFLARAAVLCFAAFLASCATTDGAGDFGAYKTGTQVTDAQMAQAVDNRTTQAEITAMLGQPGRKVQVGAKEIWYYDFQQIGHAFIGKNVNEATAFEFNQKGILVSHYKTGGQAGNPLLKAAGK